MCCVLGSGLCYCIHCDYAVGFFCCSIKQVSQCNDYTLTIFKSHFITNINHCLFQVKQNILVFWQKWAKDISVRLFVQFVISHISLDILHLVTVCERESRHWSHLVAVCYTVCSVYPLYHHHHYNYTSVHISGHYIGIDVPTFLSLSWIVDRKHYKWRNW